MTNDRRREERADDAVVDSAWRKASAEEPDARVDAAILAAARAAVRGRPPAGRATARPPWWMRWQPLAAAAGLVGVAFLLLQPVPREESWRPAPAPEARNEVAASVPAPAQRTVSARESAEGRGTADVAAATEAAAGAAQRSTAEPVAPPRSAAAWAEQIAELHASGDVAAAAVELTAFRQAHTDADNHLPQALRSWAASIRPPDAP